MHGVTRLLLVLCVAAWICISLFSGCCAQILSEQNAGQVWQLQRRTSGTQTSSQAGPSHGGASPQLSGIDEITESSSSHSRPDLHADDSQAQPTSPHDDPLADAQAVDATRIQRLPETDPQSPEYSARYGEVPFFNRAPIYEKNREPIFVLEQAIRDHGAVYVVSPDGQTLVKYVRGEAQRSADDDAQLFWEFYNMGPQINHLYKVVTGLPAVKPGLHGSDYDHVPHWGNIPIFHLGEADVAQTHKAIYHPNGFLFMSPGTRNLRAYKFTVEDDGFGFKRSGPVVESEIRKSLRRAEASTEAYGPVIASVLHGRPLQLERPSPIGNTNSLADIPRFNSHATRQDIVSALEMHGKIRYYGAKLRLEIKLGADGELQVRKLGVLDKAIEHISQSLGKLHIPH